MDTMTPEQRRQCMSHIRSRDTQPEIAIRKRLFRLGYRYRVCPRDLPGKPDIVLPKYGTVIFIHGCFWHCHGCSLSKMPTTRQGYWTTKLERNRQRDRENLKRLRRLGWCVVIVYECAFRRAGRNCEEAFDKIVQRIDAFIQAGTQQQMTIRGR